MKSFCMFTNLQPLFLLNLLELCQPIFLEIFPGSQTYKQSLQRND